MADYIGGGKKERIPSVRIEVSYHGLFDVVMEGGATITIRSIIQLEKILTKIESMQQLSKEDKKYLATIRNYVIPKRFKIREHYEFKNDGGIVKYSKRDVEKLIEKINYVAREKLETQELMPESEFNKLITMYANNNNQKGGET